MSPSSSCCVAVPALRPMAVSCVFGKHTHTHAQRLPKRYTTTNHSTKYFWSIYEIFTKQMTAVNNQSANSRQPQRKKNSNQNRKKRQRPRTVYWLKQLSHRNRSVGRLVALLERKQKKAKSFIWVWDFMCLRVTVVRITSAVTWTSTLQSVFTEIRYMQMEPSR